jgi:hypothetical protein
MACQREIDWLGPHATAPKAVSTVFLFVHPLSPFLKGLLLRAHPRGVKRVFSLGAQSQRSKQASIKKNRDPLRVRVHSKFLKSDYCNVLLLFFSRPGGCASFFVSDPTGRTYARKHC